jgi:hypothetical protein
MQPWRSIEEEFGIFDVVLLLQFTEAQLRGNLRTSSMEANVEDYVRFEINRREQPVLHTVDFMDSLVKCDFLKKPPLPGL